MAEIMPRMALVQTQPDTMGMSPAAGYPDQDSLPPQWDTPGLRIPPP